MPLILIETDDPTLVVVEEHADVAATVYSLLTRLSNEELGRLKLHGISAEQRRRVEGLPGPSGEPGTNVVVQAN